MNPAWLDLPVRGAVPELRRALDRRGTAVLAAPPGTGKTTLVPLVLAGLVPEAGLDAETGSPRRVLVAEPRRLAVRAAARRMAWLLREPVGERVGFTVRGERKAGPRTVVEVVTTGVLLQRLQRDQELAGVETVVLDECHERHLDADTALAFLLDVRATLRPDLQVLCASATSDTDAWARLLGGAGQIPAPVVESEGIQHPVEVVWSPPSRPVRAPEGLRVDPALLDHVAATVRRALREREGDVLCFLPGAGEIGRVAEMLAGLRDSVDVLQLHGRAESAVQEAALSSGARRRVVLSTSVAESSLTVPGVRSVVDCGLAREPRTDHSRGLATLVTVRASLATGRQRAGRAGREAPGTVYRCWAQFEDARARAMPTPEIMQADLTSFALQAACWGSPGARGLALLDLPPDGAMAAARDVLTALGAVDAEGRVTKRGVSINRTGLHPRLGRALLDGAALVGARQAAELVALLSEEPPRALGDDLAAVHRAAAAGHSIYAAHWRDEVRRLLGHIESAGNDRSAVSRAAAGGLVVGLAFPERIARARASTGSAKPEPGARASYLMASGTAADTAPGSALSGAEWIAVAIADRPAGSPAARVQLAAVLDEATARRCAPPLFTDREEVRWAVPAGSRRGEVAARRVQSLGAIELTTKPLAAPAPALLRAALLEGLATETVSELLTWPAEATALRQRLAFLHRVLGQPWPQVDDQALLARADQWLEPELSRARRRADLERIPTTTALTRLLPWTGGAAGRLDELAPERITVPSGSRIRVDYSADRPVLAVKIQELFGWDAAPQLADGRVTLTIHLLSPAGRPAAITSDLASFWRDGYRAVRADLRGRYPRHPWPEDPTAAQPTRRLNHRK
ncbi:ATP-dependent helicase HrpB [Catenulispora acidiphila DSM 44928]|uniref:ATP-dependent helicase HrpB n=1 Tax=Catenulispora acidiphila (strain DSM 44928 / JCM 14897 / NBRC 102108 / NRRL B-24433 / ID139908) TaxID=479433 RepID=C7PY71_CATAD|nr:ATP-dependent helicase HrpB [Catenulispora acidiphila]ACU75361.1 ATP-dependent helicase HrpB [Catenulispora acidiphila DSM 44928]